MKSGKLAAAVACMAFSGAAYGNPGPIKVVVFDQVGLAEATLREAADSARRIFHVAGLETGWSVCRLLPDPTEHCILPPADTYLKVMIVAKRAGPQKGDAMGLALSVKDGRSSVCYAFAEPLELLAEVNGVPPAVALATVMAHEVGHLLGLNHSSSGVMNSNLDRRQLLDAASGRLLFSLADAKLLLVAVDRRRDLRN